MVAYQFLLTRTHKLFTSSWRHFFRYDSIICLFLFVTWMLDHWTFLVASLIWAYAIIDNSWLLLSKTIRRFTLVCTYAPYSILFWIILTPFGLIYWKSCLSVLLQPIQFKAPNFCTRQYLYLAMLFFLNIDIISTCLEDLACFFLIFGKNNWWIIWDLQVIFLLQLFGNQ